jgi:prepilin-type N-terminal cleavage/methylation domain-containing protein
MRTKRGFTLIELLIVIAIIGVLSSIILNSITQPVGSRVRDTKRVAEVNNVAKALELYYLDNGYYPACNTPGYPGGCDLVNFMNMGINADSSLDNIFVHFLTIGKYLPNDPIDPTNSISTNSFYGYGVNSEFPLGSGIRYEYIVGSLLEDPNYPALKNSVTWGTPYAQWYAVVGSRE